MYLFAYIYIYTHMRNCPEATTPNTCCNWPPGADHGRPLWLRSGPFGPEPPTVTHPAPKPHPP